MLKLPLQLFLSDPAGWTAQVAMVRQELTQKDPFLEGVCKGSGFKGGEFGRGWKRTPLSEKACE